MKVLIKVILLKLDLCFTWYLHLEGSAGCLEYFTIENLNLLINNKITKFKFTKYILHSIFIQFIYCVLSI